jgi:hypothetical protein
MEENENIINFLSRIKDLKDKLEDIGENISNTNLVTVTLNGMLDEYQMFITGHASRERAPTFVLFWKKRSVERISMEGLTI